MTSTRHLVLVAFATVVLSNAGADDFQNQCPDDCPPFTPIVAPERFVVTDHQAAPACTFAPDGECIEGCVCMDIPLAWNQNPYQHNFFVKRAVIVVHGTGSDAIRSGEAVRRSANQLGLPMFETIILAPQFAEDDQIPVDTFCLFGTCVGGALAWADCTVEADCADPDLAYWGGSWRWGWRSKSGGDYPRPFRISSFEVIDQVIRQLTNGHFPGLEQIVVAGHSAGGQLVSRYAAATSVGSEINVPMRYVSSAPARVLYLDHERWEPGTVPRVFSTPASGCDCPEFSDGDLSEYNDYPHGLEKRDEVDNGNNPYLANPTDQDFRNQYANHEVAHIVGERDTCLYNTGGTCSGLAGCQMCVDPCTDDNCDDDCNAAPPACRLAIQGTHHVETAFVYRDYLVNFYGPQILAKHRFEIMPCFGHSTCCSWQSPKGKKYLFDIHNLIDGFDWNPGPLINGWLDAPDNVNGNLVNVNGELVPSTANLNLAGAYRPVPASHGLRFRALVKETDGVELSGRRFAHHFMAFSHGVRTSGYGVAVERSGATTSDSRITLYENGSVVATAFSTFQFESEVELEFAVYLNGRIEGSVVEAGNEFAFSFPERPPASSGINFLYHTAWAAPGSTTPPRLDFVTIHEISPPVATPPGGSHTMTVDKLDPSGSALSITWDTSCPSAQGYHIVYGGGSQLPSSGGGFSLTGAECGVGTISPFFWSAAPSTSSDPSGLIWWLLLANDGAVTEGSWGLDGAGNERTGPGVDGASGQCGVVNRDATNPCGR